MATRWAIRVALAGWLVFVALVGVLGSPWLTRYWSEHSGSGAGGRFAGNVLSFPEWGPPGYPIPVQGALGVSVVLRTVLIVVVVGLLMWVTARSMGARPAGLGVLLTVWMAVVVGAGLVAALMAPVILSAETSANFPALDGHLTDVVLASGGAGAAFGFWVGWLPALVAAPFGRRAARAAGGPELTPGPAPAHAPARY